MHNSIALDLSVRVDKHDTILVALNHVVLDEQLFLALDHEDSLATLRVADVVVHDSCFSGLLTAQGNVGLDVVLDFVGDDLSRAALNDKNALIVVALDHVGIGERFDAQLRRHCDVVVVQRCKVICLIDQRGTAVLDRQYRLVVRLAP